MVISIYDLDSKFPNIAVMKTINFCKRKGFKYEKYIPLKHDFYDKIFAFSLFNFTDKQFVSNKMECGGTGFDIMKTLPLEIECCDLDYSFYPDSKLSIQFLSRGCIRKCPFCVVPQKEGFIRPVEPMNLNPIGESIEILDNNFFANPEWRTAIATLKKWNQPVHFGTGIDARILDEEQAKALLLLHHSKQIKMAWDNPKEKIDWQNIIKWIPAYRIMVFVLIGYNSTQEEDLYRIEYLRALKIDPFVMPYNKKDLYQNNLARYVNHKAIFKSISFVEYLRYRKYRSVIDEQLKLW